MVREASQGNKGPIRDVRGVLNCKNVNGFDRVLKQNFDPFKGKTNHCIRVLAPFNKTDQGTTLGPIVRQEFTINLHLPIKPK